MLQRLNSALTDNLSSVPSTHSGWLPTACDPSSRRYKLLFCSLQALATPLGPNPYTIKRIKLNIEKGGTWGMAQWVMDLTA